MFGMPSVLTHTNSSLTRPERPTESESRGIPCIEGGNGAP
jgi:hypothetical protein